MADLDELRRIAPPPPDPPPPVDFDAARAALGVDLPDDYVALAEEWGAGSFADFLWVHAPGQPNRNLDLVHQAGRRRGALEELAGGGEELPHDPRVVSGGLLPWGATDNGDVCYWLLHDRDDPASWTVAVNESRGPDWHRFDGGVVAFLAAWLSGRETVSVFPDDVPIGAVGFRRWTGPAPQDGGVMS